MSLEQTTTLIELHDCVFLANIWRGEEELRSN